MEKSIKEKFKDYINVHVEIPEVLKSKLEKKFAAAMSGGILAIILSLISSPLIAEIFIIATIVLFCLFFLFASPIMSGKYEVVENAILITNESKFHISSLNKRKVIVFKDEATNKRYACDLSKSYSHLFDEQFKIYFTTEGFQKDTDITKVKMILSIESILKE